MKPNFAFNKTLIRITKDKFVSEPHSAQFSRVDTLFYRPSYFSFPFLENKREKKLFCVSFSVMAASILACLISKD